ncbi:uncharacterized protein LOC110264150 [Arachis ipaensis]|uniref:uncharacterized protein LOC110264150 n=1 Tax=Arachis ipaensis TaxID=130454 RepID=UPI000A2AF106|nr:uncharacterized protein LOC110264150 [Arachis ipaensis]
MPRSFFSLLVPHTDQKQQHQASRRRYTTITANCNNIVDTGSVLWPVKEVPRARNEFDCHLTFVAWKVETRRMTLLQCANVKRMLYCISPRRQLTPNRLFLRCPFFKVTWFYEA